MSIGNFFKNISQKFDAFTDKINGATPIARKKMPRESTQKQRTELSIVSERVFTGYSLSAPSYAKSFSRELLIREKINLFQKEHAKEASRNFVDRLVKVFNSSTFRSNPWLYIDRWKEQGKNKHFAQKEQPLALDFFENQLLKEMSPVNLSLLSRDRDLSIKAFFKNSSFRENPLLFIRTIEKQQPQEDDQETLEIIKKSIHIKSIKLDMEYLQRMADQHPLEETRNTRDHVIAVLTDSLFQKNPAIFMEDWRNERGNDECQRYGEDDAKDFFKEHLTVTSISVRRLLNEIQKEPKEIRKVLKQILYNPIFQRHPTQFLEQLGNKSLSELEHTARTWFLSKFDPAAAEIKDLPKAEDSMAINNAAITESFVPQDAPSEAEGSIATSNTAETKDPIKPNSAEAEDSTVANNTAEVEDPIEPNSAEAEDSTVANSAAESEDLMRISTAESGSAQEVNDSAESEDSISV